MNMLGHLLYEFHHKAWSTLVVVVSWNIKDCIPAISDLCKESPYLIRYSVLVRDILSNHNIRAGFSACSWSMSMKSGRVLVRCPIKFDLL